MRGRAGRQRAALQREQKGAGGPSRPPPPAKVSAKPPAATKPPAAVKITRPERAAVAKSAAGPPTAKRAGPPVAKNPKLLAAKSPEPPVVKRSSLDAAPVQRSPPPDRPLATALGAPSSDKEGGATASAAAAFAPHVDEAPNPRIAGGRLSPLL